MKILFMCDPHSPNTVSWINGLREHGCEVRIVSARYEGCHEDVLALGASFLPPRLRILSGARKIRKYIKDFKPDIILAYRVTSYGYLGALTGFHPFVIAAQNEQITFLRKKSFLRKKLLDYFARKAIKNADLLHAWSLNIAEGLKKYGAKEEQIFLSHRGIDTNVFRMPEQRSAEKTKKPVIISTRSLYSEYLLDELLRVFSIFLKSYPEARLIMVGEGPEKDNLINEAAKLGITENVSFEGKLDPQKIASLLLKADIYVSLIRTEGLSSSLLEACACGVFPVVADIPASEAVIEDAENGILLPESTTDETARKLIAAYENTDLRKKSIKINSELISEKFDRKKNILLFLQKYKELANL